MRPLTGASDGRGPAAGVVAIFVAFLRLGLTSFGGPVAHLGYFRAEFVLRRRWLDESRYAELVALCQFLPGPTSSQVGFGLGLQRAGWAGALAAWAGFTLPSALLMIAVGHGVLSQGQLAAAGAIHGLKVVTVAVVALAVRDMARSLCPDRPRAVIAILSALLALVLPTALGQFGALLLAAALGRWWLDLPPIPASPSSRASMASGSGRGPAAAALAVFATLLVGLPAIAAATGSVGWTLVDGFFRAGALIFGGGHVLLPLLQAVVGPTGLVDDATFLAGYGAAQALPGPLTSFVAYLGTVMDAPFAGGLAGLALMTVTFLPAFLLLAGVLPFWETWRRRSALRELLAGTNAGVVGVLLAALYDPVWTGAIADRTDFALALAAFGLLAHARVSPVLVVLAGALAGWALA